MRIQMILKNENAGEKRYFIATNRQRVLHISPIRASFFVVRSSRRSDKAT
jgi:hypothetical protein